MYRFVEHRADLAIAIEEESREKLFKSALEALKDLLTGNPDRDFVLSKVSDACHLNSTVIEADGYDNEERLIELMNKFIFLCQVEKKFPIIIKDLYFKLDETVCASLELLSGDHDMRLEREIKAATYHDLKITSGEKWQVKVVLDV